MSVLTSYLRETNKQIEQINSTLEATKQQEEKYSDIYSLRSHFKELTHKMTDVAQNVKRLEYNVLQIEDRVSCKI